MPPKTCPECGTDLKGLDPYKHAVACFHLAPGRPEDILAQEASRGNDVRYERIKALLGAAKGGD